MTKSPTLKPRHVYLMVSGDLRLSANQQCWPEQAKMEAILTRRSVRLGANSTPPLPFDPTERYTVFFDIDPSVYSISGAQLMTNGVRVLLPTPYSSEVVHIQRQ